MLSLKKLKRRFFVKNSYPDKKFNSADYWRKRYKSGGNSGAGSYGRLAEFKSRFLNQFILSNHLKTMIEHGCGDGNLASMVIVDEYLGADISMSAVELCTNLMSTDKSKKFISSGNLDTKEKHDLSLSSDVIFHLTEDDIYHSYMVNLFDTSSKFVIVYSSNHEDNEKSSRHVRHRNFSAWIEKYRKDFRLASYKKNKYPFHINDPSNTSFSDFYVYEKRNIQSNADVISSSTHHED
tara:strand:- start:2493 stop:3203 length:711 start_codon:yes stop_codon:yes gene_type:complete